MKIQQLRCVPPAQSGASSLRPAVSLPSHGRRSECLLPQAAWLLSALQASGAGVGVIQRWYCQPRGGGQRRLCCLKDRVCAGMKVNRRIVFSVVSTPKTMSKASVSPARPQERLRGGEENNCRDLCHPPGIPAMFISTRSPGFGRLAQSRMPGAKITPLRPVSLLCCLVLMWPLCCCLQS